MSESEAATMTLEEHLEIVQEAVMNLTEDFVRLGVPLEELEALCLSKGARESVLREVFKKIAKFSRVAFLPLVCLLLGKFLILDRFINETLRNTRCLIPGNFFIWEITRPVSDCEYCQGVNYALILPNLTRDAFERYAYSSRPMIVREAAKNWPASTVFDFIFFKELYARIEGAYESVDEEGQFLHFKSDFANLQDFLAMSDERAENREGQESWYVGWKNVHPEVLREMHRYYEPPHFLPEDAEMPYANFVFLGYDRGAAMHLDYISRLMWQGQLLGSKTWNVAPTPECDHVCKPFSFFVGTGDVVLLDTRIWYHSTHAENGQFSLTISSEYG